MRSKLSAITARTPRRFGPLAAQSRDDPEPYSLPARMISGTLALRVFHAGVEDRHLLALGQQPRHPALGPRRQLVAQAHVGKRPPHHHLVIAAPRSVAVKVRRLHAMLGQVFPAGPSALMLPAGEMWSVVTESPSTASTRAPLMSSTGAGSASCRRSTAPCECKSSPAPTGTHRRWESSALASSHLHWSRRRIPCGSLARNRLRDRLRHLRLRRPNVAQEHLLPLSSLPSGSASKLCPMRPASANATTSGGLIK